MELEGGVDVSAELVKTLRDCALSFVGDSSAVLTPGGAWFECLHPVKKAKMMIDEPNSCDVGLKRSLRRPMSLCLDPQGKYWLNPWRVII